MIIENLSIKNTVSVTEFGSIYKHKFTKETCQIKGSVHGLCEIIYPIENEVYMTVDNKEYIIKEGEMFIYAPNTYHILTKPFDATVYIVTFNPDYKGIEKFYNRVLKPDESIRIYFVKIMEEMYKSFCYVNQDGVFRLSLNEGISKIKGEIIKKKFEMFLLMLEDDVSDDNSFKSKKMNTELSTIINNLKSNISENYSIYDIARISRISEGKLRKLFKSGLDISPISYFHKLKIDYAKTLLLEGEKNITEISEKLGFQSIHYFSRFFKKHTGSCPTDYIKALNSTEFIKTGD